MSAKIVFLRRTPKEKEIFGGEVFIDIDGKNVGILGLNDFIVELGSGKHRFKVYKSHTYDTFIGFAETEINIVDGNDLLIKYSPPMLVNQPGNLVVSDYKSTTQIETIVEEKENRLKDEYEVDEQKKAELREKNELGVTIFIIIMIIIAIITMIQISSI